MCYCLFPPRCSSFAFGFHLQSKLSAARACAPLSCSCQGLGIHSLLACTRMLLFPLAHSNPLAGIWQVLPLARRLLGPFEQWQAEDTGMGRQHTTVFVGNIKARMQRTRGQGCHPTCLHNMHALKFGHRRGIAPAHCVPPDIAELAVLSCLRLLVLPRLSLAVHT